MNTPKILILGVHRCGTTALTKAFRDLLKLKTIFEPWNQKNSTTDLQPEFFNSWDLVKSIPYQIPENYSHTDCVEFYIGIFNKFDYVILLSGKDKKRIVESFWYQLMYGNRSTWHSFYTVDKVQHFDLFNRLEYNQTNKLCDDISTISEKSNIQITWYEDLFSGDFSLFNKTVDNWGIEINRDKLFDRVHPKRRYRKFEDKIYKI